MVITLPLQTHDAHKGPGCLCPSLCITQVCCLTLIPGNLAQPLFSEESSSNKRIKSNFKSTKILLWS